MNHNQYLIGPCLLDCQTMCLTYKDETIKLSVKVFELLRLFLVSDENIVSRQVAIESIWLGNEGVGKRGYTNAVWTLRKTFKALGIDDENTFVTLSKVGYQLTLAVEPVNLKEHATNIEVAHSPKSTMSVTLNWLVNHKMVVGFVIASVIFSLVMLIWLNTDHFNSNRSDQVSENNIALPEHKKITNFEGIEEHPAISNNGQYVAFTWVRGDLRGSIYIQDLHNSSTPLRLISVSNKEEASPAWSFSDESLAYVRISDDGSCQVRVRHIVTNNDVLIDDDCYYEPFKRVLAWSNGHDNELTYAKRVNGKVALYSYDFVSKAKSQVTSPSADEIDFAPHWSSDNKNLAFIREKVTQGGNILLQAEDNSISTILTKKLSVIDMDWDLQNNEIYASYAENGKFVIKQISLQTAQEKLISDRGLPSNLTFSNKTGKLLFTNHISKEYIAQISLETGRILRKISSSSRDLYGRYVASTGVILFLSNRAGNWSVWQNRNNKSANLTEGMGNTTVPSISPDGNLFVVNISSVDGQSRNLYLGSMITGNLQKIDTENLQADNLSWSRDGQFIYFYDSNNTNSGIYKLNLSTKDIVKISNTGEQYAIEGDDGKLYVTKSNRSGIWTFDPKTKRSKLFTAELASYDYAAYFWQDGQIYYLNRDPKADQIKRLSVGAEPEVVISYPPNSIKKYFSIAPATQSSFLATLKISNESDITEITTPKTLK